MPNYTNFDQVLRDKKLSTAAQRDFMHRWLTRNYDIDYDAQETFFTEVGRVHNHDGQPPHFGRVPLENSLGIMFVQLVRESRSQRWRLALSFPDTPDEAILLPPLETNGGVASQEVLEFKTLLAAPPLAAAAGTAERFGDLATYTSASLTDADVRAQHDGQLNPATIPAYLYDPNWVPGVPGAQQTDPTIGLTLDAVPSR